MTQVNGAIYLSLVCPFGGRHEATVNSPRIHDLFITLCTALVTSPGDNWHLTLAKKAIELIALNNTEKCFHGPDFKIGLIPLGKCHRGKFGCIFVLGVTRLSQKHQTIYLFAFHLFRENTEDPDIVRTNRQSRQP